MKAALLAFVLFIVNILDSMTLTCNVGKGTMDNPCYINVFLLPRDKTPILIDIPSNIDYAVINCGRQSCQYRVRAYIGAIKTRILCPEPDSCIGSKFYCARGPPDSIQDNYRGRGDKEPECILEIKYGVSSTAKNVEFAVFEGGKGLVDSNGDNAFGGGNYRCYSDNCKLNCQFRSSCNDAITYLGTKPIMCSGDCTGLLPSSENKMPFPIIATPDINGNCVINPKQIISTKSDVPIVFPNKCETATLNCVQYSGICEEREIYCSPDDECKIICGGQDPLKPGELITGACKLATIIIGPPGPNHVLPRTVNEAMLDVDFDSKLGKDKLKAIITLEGKESCGKCTVESVSSDTVINANGPNTFTEGSINCGFNPNNIAVNRAANKGSCDLVCTNVGEPACDKCAVSLNSIAFSSIGANCINVNNPNRMKSINGDNNENNLDKTSIVPDGDGISNKQISAIIVTLSTILIIIITIMCVYYRYESSNIVSEKTGLITDDNNREMINMDNKY